MDSIGIDFGTTNTVVAFADKTTGEAHPYAFPQASKALESVRTVLSFGRNVTPGGEPAAEIGPWAIDAFIAAPEETRFLQSFKSFAASRSFVDTAIFTKRYRFEDLMAAYLGKLRHRAQFEDFPRTVLIGRPVAFAGQSPDDALAQERYAKALGMLGISKVHYILEPAAAAAFYARRLTRNATVLVGDFGGGTSDFSVLRFRTGGTQSGAEALGYAGVGIAGDSFDYRIIDNVVSPLLGKGTTYRSWGKSLTIPIHYYASFSRWNELCLMQRPAVLRQLRELARTSEAPDQLEAFISLIEGGVTYELYRAVAEVKAQLSREQSAVFSFNRSGVAIEAVITREDFERWISGDLELIGHAADRAIADAGLEPGDIDRVFLTGGSSFVPGVRKLFERRFPKDRIESGDELLSIAKGLAIIGASGETAKWEVHA